MHKLNILIVGVGGQGTLLASRIIGNVALKKNYAVKVSEVHGMSQRGGSVVVHVKIGQKVCSPLVEKGEADVILAFEQLEAWRWLEYLKQGGKIIINEQKINPMPVIIGKAKYPDGIIDRIKETYGNVVSANALQIAMESGSIKAVNLVLLGIMAKSISIEKELWLDTIKETVLQKFLGVNIKAFEAGYSIR
ncbi:MAG: indolepyruvate oxidoreductase subunit beta [Thermodesulfobacteriota bacterium]|jgi:indolepyruvate ferredoxin oxidoreductase beta subunit|nr:MAG: indolepyruvate oxidoreductase subunit beta [Thermodesulfobacteriota bacterium]